MYRLTIRAAAVAATAIAAAATAPCVAANEPDNVLLLAYADTADEGRGGLRFAWSPDSGATWLDVAQGTAFLTCDYGRWGDEKRMIGPALSRDNDGTWHCTWQLNPQGDALGHTSSTNLYEWLPQDYLYADDPAANYDKSAMTTAKIGSKTVTGTAVEAPFSIVRGLTLHGGYMAEQRRLNGETAAGMAGQLASPDPLKATITVNPAAAKPISDMLIGIFFEDINYGADGGLYAELVQNRDFEYSPDDRPEWTAATAWKATRDGAEIELEIATRQPLHANNPHYAVLNAGTSLSNAGFDGIALKKGEKYDFSLYCRKTSDKSGTIAVALIAPDGGKIAAASVKVSSREWRQLTATMTATADAADATLTLTTDAAVDLDMISLFPRNTFRGRKNGLRADLAQTLADLKPRFVRFPGGCVAHGDGVDNIYDWKGSIGPLHERRPLSNLWGYHQTRGLGYHEYFQFCEDIEAEPLPVIAAGVPCQNSSKPSHHTTGELSRGGQQGGVPIDEMGQYVEDVLDLIEYANGDAKSTTWGKIRAQNGHPEPFGLKYVGIGNEDLISQAFKTRFKMIYHAVRERYPEITVIGTVGPFYFGSDYDEGWKFAAELDVPIVDEHYYCPPGWFVNNQSYYDSYDRGKSHVYLGEYAAHLDSRASNIETALAEALYLTAVERNADVVAMTSYAPLLAKDGRTQWNPDLIYFSNTDVRPTVGYYTQQLFSLNSGTEYIPADVTIEAASPAAARRVGVSVVTDAETGDIILKMVNLLPAAVDAAVSLPQLSQAKEAALTVLTGSPDDSTATPTTGKVAVDANFSYTMPAYSLNIIRIDQNKND